MALTAAFVSAVRRQGQFTSQLSSDDILSAGDVEVAGRFVPLLRRIGADFGVRRIVLPIDAGRVAIPDRSQMAGVRLVQYINGNFRQNLRQMTPEDDTYSQGATAYPEGWYFDAGSLCIIPSSAAGSLLVRYYQRPSSMILSSTVASTSEITSIVDNGTTTTLTFAGGTTASDGDVVSAGPAHQVVVPAAVSGTGSAAYLNSIYATVDNDKPVELGAPLRTINQGDWVAPNGRTPFVPLPEELFAALVHRVAGTLLSALGYLEEANAQLGLADGVEETAIDMLTPRADGNPMVLTGGLAAALGQNRGPWGW